jgi:DNA ligase-1
MTENIVMALKAFEDLENTPGKLGKLDILSKHSDNGVFKDLLSFTYDPFKVYYVKKLPPIPSGEIHDMEENFKEFMALLVLLYKRQLTGNAALDAVVRLFSHLTNQELKWYNRILLKDLNVGIKDKTINEAIPGLITVFRVMLAEELDRYPKRMILQPKYDGMRIMGNTTTGRLYSRNGKEVLGFTDIENDIKKLPGGHWIDGEIMSGGKFNTTMTQAFRKKDIPITGKPGFLNSFDLLTEGEFKQGVSVRDQENRDHLLGLILKDIPLDFVSKVNSSEIILSSDPMSMKKIDEIYLSFLDQGYEGAMVKDLDALYVCDRKRHWQKLKPVKSYDIKVVGMEKGKPDTQWEDGLGKLVCLYEGNEVRVSGMSNAQRETWWNDPTLIVGKTIEVIAQEVTENQKGTPSLRFPRFKCIRDDK